MKIIQNRYIPFKGFNAINLFGVLFVRIPRKEISSSLLCHEAIHTAQMRELGYILFYVIYFSEWVYRVIFCKGNAYRNLSFEREAYRHQHDPEYLGHRRRFAQWRQ